MHLTGFDQFIDKLIDKFTDASSPGHVQVAQLVTYLQSDTGPGVSISIPVGPILSWGYDHEIISTAILFSSANSRRIVVSYKRKYVHKEHVLVNCLVKLAQEKSLVG